MISASREYVLGSYFSYLLILLMAIGIHVGGYGLLFPFIFGFLIVPLLDAIFGSNTHNFDSSDFSRFERAALRFSPVGYVLLTVAVLFYTLSILPALSLSERIFATISLGVISAVGLTAGHDLLHKRNEYRRSVGLLCYGCVSYLYFEWSHLYNHHRAAGTEEDNHTAKAGESLYAYVLRSKKHEFQFCFRREALRLKQEGKPFFSIGNRFLRLLGIPLLLNLFVFSYFGWVGWVVYALQSIMAVVTLDVVAYIQHYGMWGSRSVNENTPETARYSWDSYKRISTYLTFMVQRHASHHYKPAEELYCLRSDANFPQMPYGYPTMITIALWPALWFRIMDPLLEQERLSQGLPPG